VSWRHTTHHALRLCANIMYPPRWLFATFGFAVRVAGNITALNAYLLTSLQGSRLLINVKAQLEGQRQPILTSVSDLEFTQGSSVYSSRRGGQDEYDEYQDIFDIPVNKGHEATEGIPLSVRHSLTAYHAMSTTHDVST
jgi:hypothetical protein